jgi:hypothetical protein
MATAILHSLPLAPHQLWQTAASPFILPNHWQSMYQRCPRCGGRAPNICDEVWPEGWWEDDMLGLMYQGHIPPSKRMAPWEEYYARSRVAYSCAPATVPEPYTPLRIDPHYSQPQQPHIAAYHGPMTPPQTPGIPSHAPSYSLPPRAVTPPSPSLPYARQGTFNTVSSFDSVHSTPSQVIELGTTL